jgi:three-Cys-motif partner protein
MARAGSWAVEKYRHVWAYDQIFSRGMKNQWHERVYIDLFSGPGRSQDRKTGVIYPGSPMLALTVPDRFTRYIFADEDAAWTEVLEQRIRALSLDGTAVSVLSGDSNLIVDRIV